MAATQDEIPYTSPVAIEIAGGSVMAHRKVSWSAIFAGVMLVLAIEVLLDVLGAGAGIWWLVSTVIALIIGSYSTARLAGVPTRFDGVLHKLVIWGLTLLLTIYLMTTAVDGLIGGAVSVVGGTVSAAGSAVGSIAAAAGSEIKAALQQIEQATGINPNVLQQQANDILLSPTPQNPRNMSRTDSVKAIGQVIPALLSGDARAAAAKQRIIAIVTAQAHITRQDAKKRVNAAQTRLVTLKNKTLQTAKKTADASAATASHASFLALAGILIGAIAGAIGGGLASPISAWLPVKWDSRSIMI